MAYAFCLRFDAETEGAVVGLWRAQAESGASDDMLRLGYAPHLSLAVLDNEPPRAVVEAALAEIEPLAHFAIRLGGVERFPDTPIVWLAAEGGGVLTDLHNRLLNRLPVEQVREHYRLGQWVPHVTLQTEGDALLAMKSARMGWPAAVSARCVSLELVQFPPITVLKSRRLG